MRIEQLTKCFELSEAEGEFGYPLNRFEPPTDRAKAVLLMWFFMFLALVSVSVLFSPSMCLDYIWLGSGSCVATFWERAAYSVNRMFSLLCLFVALVVYHFGFEGRCLRRLPITFQK